jgi:uncharacterized damage-inducible protein DinB
MKNIAAMCLLALALIVLVPAPLQADHHTLQGEFVGQVQDMEKKLVGLAEATPEDKYTWRPGEGVRSVAEVFLHIAGANYFFLNMLGAPPPEGVDPRNLEKSTTAKADVIAALKKSMEHARASIEKMSEEDLMKAMKLFGRDTTQQGALLVFVRHMGEHLGQSIAYARVNGIKPPWSGGD